MNRYIWWLYTSFALPELYIIINTLMQSVKFTIFEISFLNIFFSCRVTFCHLPFQSKWLYVGTERGNIHIVNVESFTLSGYVIMWNKAIELWVWANILYPKASVLCMTIALYHSQSVNLYGIKYVTDVLNIKYRFISFLWVFFWCGNL